MSAKTRSHVKWSVEAGLDNNPEYEKMTKDSLLAISDDPESRKEEKKGRQGKPGIRKV